MIVHQLNGDELILYGHSDSKDIQNHTKVELKKEIDSDQRMRKY